VSACDELRPKAAGIAALPDGDPERESFLAHARSCSGCMEALREGENLLAALARVELPPPSSRALRRASAPILADLTPSRWGLRALAALVAFAIPLLFSRHRDTEGWAAALVVLVLATALSSVAGALRAGAWVALGASAGFAIAAGGIPGLPDTEAGLAMRVGVDCLALELAGGAAAAALVLWRAGRSAASLAPTAAAGALAAQAALHLACTAHAQAPHLWAFHVGGVVVAALAGWTLQNRLAYSSSARN
jgi:hypothetical protein